jgi:hypothetical protein
MPTCFRPRTAGATSSATPPSTTPVPWPSTGTPARSLGPLPDEPTGAVRDLAVGHDVAGWGSTAFESHPVLAVLETRGDLPVDWLTAGQALLRVLLSGTQHGVAASFANQPLEDPDLRAEVASEARHYGNPQMILRLGMGADVAPTPRPRPPGRGPPAR